MNTAGENVAIDTSEEVSSTGTSLCGAVSQSGQASGQQVVDSGQMENHDTAAMHGKRD